GSLPGTGPTIGGNSYGDLVQHGPVGNLYGDLVQHGPVDPRGNMPLGGNTQAGLRSGPQTTGQTPASQSQILGTMLGPSSSDSGQQGPLQGLSPLLSGGGQPLPNQDRQWGFQPDDQYRKQYQDAMDLIKQAGQTRETAASQQLPQLQR